MVLSSSSSSFGFPIRGHHSAFSFSSCFYLRTVSSSVTSTSATWYIYIYIRAGTNTPSDEYDSYREYRVANTNMYSRIHFFSEAKLGNGLSVLVYACTGVRLYSAQKFHFANLPCIWENQRISKPFTYTWLEGLRSPQHSYP